MNHSLNTKCINCDKSFEVTSEDLRFYKRMDVPSPTHCPNCRQQRRLAWRNERTLYANNCDLCKKNLVSSGMTKIRKIIKLNHIKFLEV